MKKLILFISLIISTSSYAQGPFAIDSVIRAENKTAKEIYASIKAWSATAFIDSKSATQVEDPEACFISFNPVLEYKYGKLTYAAFNGYVSYTVTIKCKDGRFKITLTNVIHKNLPGHAESCNLGLIDDIKDPYTKGINKKYKNTVAADIKWRMNQKFLSICADILKAIDSGNSSEEDW